MLTIDYLIANAGRHYNNFGAVRNAEILEWSGLAPIFDCGTSMWSDQLTNRIILDDDTPSKPFKVKYREQIELVTSFEWLDFSKLNGIIEEYEKLLLKS